MNATIEPAWRSGGWREFLDLLTDGVLVFDAHSRVAFVNTAALRLLPAVAGLPLDQLAPTLGVAAVQWLAVVCAGGAGRPGDGAAPLARLNDGRMAEIAWRPLDGGHSALRLTLTAAPAPRVGLEGSLPSGAPAWPAVLGAEGLRETLRVFWESPFPALLQDERFRIVDANDAFVAFTGRPRASLVGRDPMALFPPAQHARMLARRERLRASGGHSPEPVLAEGRMLDAEGRELRFRMSRRTLIGPGGELRYLAVLQDSTAEHVARERAERSLREIDDWFGLSPVGMVLFDAAGLLLRTNHAFDALVGTVPASLADAPQPLRDLLGWGETGADDGDPAATEPSMAATPLQRQGVLSTPQRGARMLRATLRRYATASGQQRCMAVLEDRSADEERELAQLQIGALIDTAGLALATYQTGSGWVRQRGAGGLAGASSDASADTPASEPALHAISRDIVEPASLPEFEKVQHAVRHAQRTEARYAVNHPGLGQRWLLTRVEPALLASGASATTVVTLDITQQHLNQQRSEQLLHELSMILDSTSAGIAFLRGPLLVRCNRRFEAMLGLPAELAAGTNVASLFMNNRMAERLGADALEALTEGVIYETEFEWADDAGLDTAAAPRWYALSVRRAGPASGAMELTAVLSDVTRLKAQAGELEALARDRELMFSLSGVGIAFLRSGRIERANQALAHLAGCGVPDMVGMPLAALFPEGEFETRWAQTERALLAHGRWTGERPLRLRDGRALWVQVSKQLVTRGNLAGGVIASYVNVDARHRAERAVALQAERTRAILDSVLVGIVTVGPQGIEWMNRSARRMFGGDLADFVTLPIATVATPEPGHPFRRTEYLTELVEGQAETFECRVQARDGREFWVVGNVVSTARESTGRQLTYALLDIERRRQAEARTTQAQASLQRIIEAAPLAISLRDAHTLKILQVNTVAANANGTTPAALVGLTPEDMFEPALAAERRDHMERALAATDVSVHEYTHRIDGEDRVFDVRYLPLASVAGQAPDQLLLVATDVTEQRAAQQARLEAAIEQRDMLVKEVHHRIKNNLQGVAGLLEQIAQRKPEVAGAIAEVVGQVHAIAHVYGLQVGESGPLPVASVVKAIAASVQRTFGRAIQIVLEAEPGGPDPQAWLLPESESIPIALTLNELLTNAVKHSKHELTAELSCRLVSSDTGVVVSITNAGALPPGFSVARIRGGMSGLGLVRALLPRRNASLRVEQHGTLVVTTVALQAPAVVRSTSD